MAAMISRRNIQDSIEGKWLRAPVRQMKRGSSAWIHQHGVNKFAWQEGYGAFTVSPSQLPKVQQYIANQIEHHRTKTFEEEYFDLLRLSGVEFDEKYLG